MKLLDILARELKVWPETTLLAQDSNGHVFGWTGFPSWDGDQWLVDVGASLDKCRPGEMDLADDHMTASVTRAEWQGAVDAQKAEKDAEIKWPNAATHYKPSMGAGKNPVFYHILDGRALYAWAVLSSGKLLDCPTNNPYGWDFDYSTAIPRPVESAADQINAPKVVEWDGVGLPPIDVEVEFRPDVHAQWCVATAKYHSLDFSVFSKFGEESPIWNPKSWQFRPIRTAEQVAAEEREKAAEALYMAVMDHTTQYWPALQERRKEHYRGLVDAGWQKVAK